MSSKLPNVRLVDRLQALSRYAGLLTIVVGCLVMIGWLFNIEIFKSVLPGLVAMKFNTALAFVLAGGGLLSLRGHPRRTQAAGLVVLLLGLLTLGEYGFGWDLRIDQWLVHDAVTALSNYPGRMSPVTAFNFCLIGSSLLLMTHSRRFALPQSLMLGVVFTALLALTGYIYGVTSLYQIGLFSSIALHTTLTFILFGLGLIFAAPEQGLTAALVTNRAGALLLRRLLPATIVVSLLLAWLQQKGQQAGLFAIDFGLALFAMSNMVIFTLLICWSAYSLNRVDDLRAEQEARRWQADDAIQRYTQRLEMLHDIDKGILEARSIPTVIEAALKHLQQLIPCQQVGAVLFDFTSSEVIVFAVESHFDSAITRGKRLPLPPAFLKQAGTSLVTVIDDLLLLDEPSLTYQQLIKEGMRSSLRAILRVEGSPIGVLSLTADTPGFFTAEHQEIAVEVAGQIAIAVNQLRLSEELTHHAAELERHVLDLKQATEALHQANEQLELRVEARTRELTETNHTLEVQIIQREEAENKFRALLESAPDAVIITHLTGEVMLINAQTERFFGYSRDELLGQPIELLIPEPFRSRHSSHRINYTADPQVRTMGARLELSALRKDGSHFPVEVSLSPIQTDQGILIASSIRDITERKQVETALRENEEKLQTIIKLLPVGVSLMTSDQQIVQVNLALKKILAMTMPDLLQGKYQSRQYIHTDGTPMTIAEFPSERVIKEQRAVYDVEMGVIKEDGETIWTSVSAALLPHNQGIVVVTVDMTERKEAEAVLRANKEKLETIFNLLPVGMSLINNERQIIEMNPAQERLLGMSLDDIMTGKYLARPYLHGDGTPVLAGEYPSSRAMSEQRAIFDAEIGFVKEDGATVWTTVSAAPLPGNQGLVMVMADMTERKRAEQERQRLYSALDMVAEGAQMISFDWCYLYLNDAAAQRARHTKAEMLGATMMEIYPGVEQTPVFDVLRRCMDQRVSQHLENPFTFPDNRTGWFDLHIQPIPEGLFILSTDITERKRAEAQSLALAAERQRSELLREFITGVSHDFRTPLAIMGTSAYLVGKTSDPGKLVRYSQRIEEQIVRLTQLLDNFVELARLEQQVSSFPLQSADVDTLVRSILEESQRAVAEHHLQLEYHCETPSVRVLGDPAALTKTITNLVSNAIHFTPDGGEIRLRLYSEGGNAILEVADTGIGIPADNLPHIFESFYRVDSARSTATGGAGLGLSIAKRIVELLKGHLEVTSEFGVGSIFKIYLPLEQ